MTVKIMLRLLGGDKDLSDYEMNTAFRCYGYVSGIWDWYYLTGKVCKPSNKTMQANMRDVINFVLVFYDVNRQKYHDYHPAAVITTAIEAGFSC